MQHMPPRFTAALAERLNRKAAYHVVEAVDGMIPQPGTCYVAPGGRHLHVEGRSADRAEVRLSDGPLVNSCRPAVDVLFRSAAATYGPNTLAVVLTGMGSDGALGVKELATHDASVIVQDEDSCVVYGMPRAVAELGLATEILPLPEIGPRIVGEHDMRFEDSHLGRKSRADFNLRDINGSRILEPQHSGRRP